MPEFGPAAATTPAPAAVLPLRVVTATALYDGHDTAINLVALGGELYHQEGYFRGPLVEQVLEQMRRVEAAVSHQKQQVAQAQAAQEQAEKRLAQLQESQAARQQERGLHHRSR